jgi:hypothetical protein
MANKILLIENQFTQFDTLQRELSSRYEVFPEQMPTQPENVVAFKAFMDLIRVILNPRYKRKQGERAFNELMAYINEKEPDLLVVDYILVSHSAAETGAALAKKIRGAFPPEKIIPVLFISRTPRDRIDVIKSVDSMKNKDWADKQYYAGTLLDHIYVTDVVIPKIDALLAETKEEVEKMDRVEISTNLQKMLRMPKFERAMESLRVDRNGLLNRFKTLSDIPQIVADQIKLKFRTDDFVDEEDERNFIRFLDKEIKPNAEDK